MIKTCLFPAAGYGTRFLPVTKSIPKEMLSVLTKPLIQYGVEEAMNVRIDTMAIVTRSGKNAIEDYFDRSYEIENQIKSTSKSLLLNGINNIIKKCSFTYTRQIEIKGLGDAILKGQPLLGDKPFAVILADDLCDNKQNDSVLAQMIKIHDEYPNHCIVAIEEIPKNDTNKYGIVFGNKINDNLYEVNNMLEKPEPKDAPSNLAIIGRYILTYEIFEVIKKTKAGKGGEIQITDALLTLAKKKKVLAYKFEGRGFDCGIIEGFVEATNYFAKENGIIK